MHYTFEADAQFDPEELDKIFQNCFGYRDNGTFVEVGAYDGKTYSHTYRLAKMGWRGVYIEPVPELAALCMRNHQGHQGVTVHRCAAGARNGTTQIFVDENACCGSTMNPTVCQSPKTFQAQVRTLNDILVFEGIQKEFDLLSIDVEFAECEVLSGFNAELWMPRMIMIELCETHGGPKEEWAAPARAMAKTMLEPLGYRKIFTDRINCIFVQP